MGKLTNPRVIWFKGVLFVLLGLLASGLLVAQMPDIRHSVLLGIAIWAFCRPTTSPSTSSSDMLTHHSDSLACCILFDMLYLGTRRTNPHRTHNH